MKTTVSIKDTRQHTPQPQRLDCTAGNFQASFSHPFLGLKILGASARPARTEPHRTGVFTVLQNFVKPKTSIAS